MDYNEQEYNRLYGEYGLPLSYFMATALMWHEDSEIVNYDWKMADYWHEEGIFD